MKWAGMTTSDACREWQGLLATFALSQLSDRETPAVIAHLDGCPSCRHELTQLRQTAGLLASADPSRVGAPRLSAPRHLEAALFNQVQAERHRKAVRSRVRVLLAVAALLVVVAGVGTQSRGSVPARGEQVALSGAPGIEATARLEDKPWGTQITLEVAGLRPDGIHVVWLEDAGGTRTPAGTFMAVGDKRLTVTLATAAHKGQAIALGVSDTTGHTLLRASLA